MCSSLFKSPQSRGVLALSLIATLFLLGACTDEPGVHTESIQLESNQQGGLTTSFTPPGMLAQSRAIDQNALRLSIVVNGREYLPEIEAGSGAGTLTIPITRGESLGIVVTWSELYKGQLLTLAQAIEDATVPVNEEATFTITIETDSYLTNFDDDDDQISNLDERNNDTDPRVSGPSVTPVVQVPIRIIANLPEQLGDVDSDIDETLSAVAIVDRVPVSLNREGDVWSGGTTKPANTDVLINYSFYSSIRPNVKLADWEGRRNTTETGITLEIGSNGYDYEIDNDGDGINNSQEIIDRTNPEDKNDPSPLTACEISNFEPGCNTDSDDDGEPDSVESEEADRDGDSIPDYLESRNDDADEDGFNAELDRDENDPCVPDEEAIACDDTDPPVIEPPEPSLLSYEYFEGQFESMPDFDRLTPALSGTATTFSLPQINGENFYALQFSGELYIEEDGEYTFYTESDDGSLLFIDGQLVVDNDGTHNVREKSGVLPLAAGLHEIVLEYFQNDGGAALTVNWSGPTFDKQLMPESVLFAP